MKALLFVIAVLPLMMTTAVHGELPPLIPRDLLFGNPERTSPSLSPDGKRLAWLAPDTNNVLQVWVKTVGKEDDKIITADKKRGIRQYLWAKDNRTLLYLQDSDGDENFHVYGVDLSSGNVRDYTPFQGVRAQVTDVNPDFPNEVLLSLNLRDRSLFDVYRLNLKNGALDLDTENPGDVTGWGTDPKFRVRSAEIATPEGGTEIRVRADEKSPWKTFLKVGPDEILNSVSFAADGQSLYLISSIGRDTAAVIQKNIADGQEKVVAVSDEVDAGDVMIHPRRYVLEAVSFSPGRTHWQVVDPAVKDDFAGIAKLNDGDFFVVSRTEADDIWLVGFQSDRAPGRFYRWDRKTKQGSFLFTTRPKLDGLALAEMKAVVIPARDGLKIHSYLTLPVGLPHKNLPMVLLPHGGPWARDDW
ncbi:MAG TPA: S9 family peptidase, partial [Clostridia bacterium]|nr:S9 family peptidase [Clostridia bacterium]